MKIQPKVILCDIEGTTTAISFVKETLFPYSKKFAKQFIIDNWNNLLENRILYELIELPEYKGRKSSKLDKESIPEIVELINMLIDADMKVSPLKNLQGLIWEKGFLDGTIKGHIFPDVPVAFKSWNENGIKIYIYSSGSVHAQKQLFQYSEYGNLLNYIAGHFDTNIGHKKDPQSYQNILQKLNISASNVLFLTDIVAEADAASEANIQTILLDRPGNIEFFTEIIHNQYNIIKNFNEIQISSV